jgi:hypothetical protein
LGKILLFLPIITLLSACTPANPVFDFDFSSEKTSFSLELKTSESALNVQNSSKVIVSGACEDKSKLTLTAPIATEIQCKNGAFELSLDLSAMADGEIELAVESKNVFGEIVVSQKKLIKDMTMPTLSLTQPANISSLDQTINLDGTCSESGEEVLVDEQSTGLSQKVICSSGTWTMVFNLGSDFGISSFYFKANHKDKGLNNKQASSTVVSRIVVGDYTINGVSHSGAGGSYGSMLKGNFANFYVNWTEATGMQNFSLAIYELNIGNGQYDISKCSVSGIPGNSVVKQLTSCVLTASSNYQVKMTGLNTLNQNIEKTFNFVTKALPQWRLDSRKLYFLSSFGTASASEIPYSDFIHNYDVNDGPYIINGNTIDTSLAAIQTLDHGNQKIIIAPGATKTSGVFSGNYKITDAFGNSSSFETIKFHLVMPFSWAGLIDNDFNKPGNWCGAVNLRTGCLGSGSAPSFGAKVMIDDLCTSATFSTAVGNCSPVLSANAEVHAFHMKSKSFDQNGFNLTVGDVNDALGGDFALSLTYFKQTGGQFNFPSSSGQLTVLSYFHQLGGVFYAPNTSDFIFNTKVTMGGVFATISNKDNFHHNNGTIKFLDPQGGNGGGVKLTAPADLEFFNLSIDSDGGYWKINTSNLIVNGNLTIGGRTRVGLYPQLLKETGTSKITLRGNLICSGQNKGGNLPIYINGPQSSTYNVTHADCTLPPIYLSGSGANLTEHGSSMYDLKLQGLNVGSGSSFTAPASSRKTIFKTDLLDNNSYSLYATGAFNHNNGIVEFHNTANLSEIFKILVYGSMFHQLNFVNNLGVNSFFSIENGLATEHLEFSGTSPVRLLGLAYHIQTDDLVFNKGIYNDANKLGKITISSSGVSPISVNTLDRINIPAIQLFRDINFAGSATTIDFSGATFELGIYQLTLPVGYDLYYNTSTSSGGSFNALGTTTSSAL